MSRRASKKSNGVPLIITIVIGILVIAFVAMTLTSKDKPADNKQTLPLDDYLSRGSTLRQNEYTIQGKVEERFPGVSGEMVSLLVKDRDVEKRIPIIIPNDKKNINIEREQEYIFTVRVTDIGDNNRGVLIAQSISPLQ